MFWICRWQSARSRNAIGRWFTASGYAEMDLYFAMARGYQGKDLDLIAMEMTKWFDTNYHYLVPEFHEDQTFKLSSRKILDEFHEAQALGISAKPVLLGPVTYLAARQGETCRLPSAGLIASASAGLWRVARRTSKRRRRVCADRRAVPRDGPGRFRQSGLSVSV